MFFLVKLLEESGYAGSRHFDSHAVPHRGRGGRVGVREGLDAHLPDPQGEGPRASPRTRRSRRSCDEIGAKVTKDEHGLGKFSKDGAAKLKAATFDVGRDRAEGPRLRAPRPARDRPAARRALGADGTPARHRRRHHRDPRHPGGRGGRARGGGRHPRVPAPHAAAAVGRAGSRRLVARHGRRRAGRAAAARKLGPVDVRGIGLSGQMHGVVLLDADGRPLGRSLIWCDGRSQEQCDAITSKVGAARLIELTCNPALVGFSAPKLLWVRQHDPRQWEKAKKFLLPKDYIRFRLTGEYCSEVSDASGTLLFDVTKRTWSKEMLSALELDASLLPSVHESPEVSARRARGRRGRAGTAGGHPGRGRRRRPGGGRGRQRRRPRAASCRPPSAAAVSCSPIRTRPRSTRAAACTRSATRCPGPGT